MDRYQTEKHVRINRLWQSQIVQFLHRNLGDAIGRQSRVKRAMLIRSGSLITVQKLKLITQTSFSARESGAESETYQEELESQGSKNTVAAVAFLSVTRLGN